MVKLKFKGAQHTLLKESQYIFSGEEIEVTREEADYRLLIQPGMWEELTVDKPEVAKKARIGKEVTKQNGSSNSK